jgi:pimeloyl-ACP methyl ester carboxylesterase
MTPDRISAFTSERARTKFLAAYDRTLDRLWPADRISLDVPTTFGTTRVYQTGPQDGVPVVLLPGAGGNALMWHRYVRRLSRDRRVLAIDPVGEPGASTQDKPMTDVAQWLSEVLAGLKAERAHLVGCSYGGWIALRHAMRAPDHLATLTLLDPAGFGKVGAKFLAWVIVGGLAGLAPRPLRHRAARWLHNTTLLDDDIMGMAVVTAGFRRRLPVPPPHTDEELTAVGTPALILLGERSQLYDASLVAQRIRAVLPSADVQVIPGAGHDLPMHSPDALAERVIAFMAAEEEVRADPDLASRGSES